MIKVNMLKMFRKKHFYKSDLKNILQHCHGHHTLCNFEFCHKAKVPLSNETVIALNSKVEYLLGKIDAIANNFDTNANESFNNIVAMYLNGRRIRFQVRSMKRRVEIAGLHKCRGFYYYFYYFLIFISILFFA
jgi:hypothetical protein